MYGISFRTRTKKLEFVTAIHPFFLNASSSQQQQPETSTSPFSWLKSVSKTCLHGTHLTPRQSSRVAAFDLDGVLIKTKSGGTFPKDRNDWVWWRPLVKDKLVELDKEGSVELRTAENALIMVVDILISCFQVYNRRIFKPGIDKAKNDRRMEVKGAFIRKGGNKSFG